MLQMVRDDFVPVDSELVSMNAEEEDAQVDSHLKFTIMLDFDIKAKASTLEITIDNILLNKIITRLTIMGSIICW